MKESNVVPLDLASFFPYQFSILAQQMSEYIAQIYHQQYGLTRYEWRVLATVAQHHKICAKDIMQFTRLDKMQVSRAISKLKLDNWLNQETDQQDRRANAVTLTTKGLAQYQEIVPLVQQQQQQMLNGLNDQEQQQLKSLITKLSHQLDQEH